MQITFDEPDTFRVEDEPGIYKAREWSKYVRVVETLVGAYGAIDTDMGTLYFDAGTTLVRLRELGNSAILVVNSSTLDTLRKGDD